MDSSDRSKAARTTQARDQSPAERARMLIDAGRLDEAAATLETAGNDSPALAGAWNALGRARFQGARWNTALDAFRRASTLDPRDASTWGNVAVALAALGRLEDALAAAQFAVELAPGTGALHANVGDLLYRLYRFDDAALALERALALQPRGREILNKLGCIHRAQGRYAQAEARFRDALDVDPSFGPALVNLGTQLLHLRRVAEGRRLVVAALGDSRLQAEERFEAERALAMVDWREVMEPAIASALEQESIAPLKAVLASAPASLIESDAQWLAQFAVLITRDARIDERNPLLQRDAAPTALRARWPAIEAHFAFHGAESPAEVARTLEWFARGCPPAAAALSSAELDLIRYARAITAADAMARPAAGDGVGWEAWTRFWHAALTGHRPELAPGTFKITDNHLPTIPWVRKAPPDRVAGTLRQWWTGVYPRLHGGPCRAAGVMYLLLELHGFSDGNGRLARFLGSRELAAAGLQPMVLSRPLLHRLRTDLAITRARAPEAFHLGELMALCTAGAALGAELSLATASIKR
ncbi:MAG: tetratricopeptide repeat protein [Betaproteobacteria bacterium]